MKPYYTDPWLTVYHGDARAVMAAMEPESVHCVVTSPPYWGLRDYGEPGQLGLEPTPEAYVESMVAVFREVRRILRSDGTVWLNLGDSYAGSWGAQSRGNFPSDKSTLTTNNGRGPKAGDKYSVLSTTQIAAHPHRTNTGSIPNDSGLKPKDLVGIPWRVAFALQADGWYLRSDIIWSKPNPMPESVTDRPTKSHEYLFLLSKSPRYYFDADAVRETAQVWTGRAGEWGRDGNTVAEHVIPGQKYAQHRPRESKERDGRTRSDDAYSGSDRPLELGGHNERGGVGGSAADIGGQLGRNIRSVWTVATQPYPGAHFATFPPKLIEPCIKAGTSEYGVCPECGAPWEREVETRHESGGPKWAPNSGNRAALGDVSPSSVFRTGQRAINETTGWRPSCVHRKHWIGGDVHGEAPLAPIPATVLDPFAGSGTTGMVAQSLSRRAVLIDLSMDYLGQLMDRNRDIPLGLGA